MRWTLLLALFVVLAVHCRAQIQDELGSIDFAAILGGTFDAAINAQAAASLATVDFLDVGFDVEDDKRVVRLVDFVYEQQLASNASEVGTFAMRVPFLSLVPIPNIVVDQFRVRFNVRVDSVARTVSESTSTKTVEKTRSLNLLVYSSTVKTRVSTTSSSKTTSEVKRTYSLEIEALAVGDETPRGTRRMLELLEDVIRRSPA